MQTKLCKGCKTEKPYEMFRKSARGVDGYAPRCKACAKVYEKELRTKLYETNPEYVEKQKQKSKEKYQKNKGRYAKTAKIWREKNKDKIREQEKIRRATDPEYAAKERARGKATYQRTKEKSLSRQKILRDSLSDAYIKSLMGIPAKDYISPEAIEERRQHVIATRKKIEINKTGISKVCGKCKEEKAKSEFYMNGKASYCRACSMAKSSAFAKENKERIRILSKNHYEKNKEKYKQKYKAYYEANREKAIQACREWRLKNPERYKELDKAYRDKNRDKILKRQREWIKLWRLNNPQESNARRKKHYEKHKERYRAEFKENSKKIVEQMPDRYINYILNYGKKKEDRLIYPKEILEAKRAQILLMRAIKLINKGEANEKY
jgi:uncharacterized CHY-type Zn-finger protein